jgi:hypothetical protein
MQQKAPELTVIVRHIRKNSRSGNFELVLGAVVALKYWSRKLEQPTAQLKHGPPRTPGFVGIPKKKLDVNR